MSVTVEEILGMRGLTLNLVAGRDGIDRPIRWVQVSELEDPTPWLKGGEVLLTTGMGVAPTPAKQRAYVRRLAEADLAGLGFGSGLSYKKVPKAMAVAAEGLGFPLFEVPYPVPFIAITEAVSTRLLAEQYDELQRALDAQYALTRAVMEDEGVEGVCRSLGRVVGGWALLLDLHGLPLAATDSKAAKRSGRIWSELRDSRPEGTGFSLSLVDQGHHIWIQPVGAHGRVEAFLVVGKPTSLVPFDRIVAGHALSLLAIELSKERAVADAQRRLQGDFFEELTRGGMSLDAGRQGLARFGFAPDQSLLVFAMEGGPAEELSNVAEDHFSRADGGFLISIHPAGIHVLLPADAGRDFDTIRKELETRSGHAVRAGIGGPVPIGEAARGLREARYALQVCRLEDWESAGFGDLGTYRLLLSMTEPDALRAFADSMLQPLDEYDRDHGGELIPSLRSFLDHNARWETASAALSVHRHTLRYRMRKVEELTGRRLSSSFDRMEFWLALRARELQSVQTDD